MNQNNIFDFIYSKELENKIWSKCIYVFDTSALLEFYFLSKATQDDIFQKLFSRIKGTIFIPAQVEFEYLKHRQKTLLKPISEKYGLLKEEVLRKINDDLEDLIKKSQELYNRTKKPDSHPVLSETTTKELISFFDQMKRSYEPLETALLEEIKKQEDGLKSYVANDIVLSQFEAFILVGKPYSFEEELNIFKEAELRYRLEIAPGYMDAKGGNKKYGATKFSDLVIWKQVIDLAKIHKKNVVFIINDIKDDWCYVSKNSTNKRIERPKEELIKEIRDEANVGFWMYTLSDFLYSAKLLLGIDIAENSITEVREITIKKDIVIDQIHDTNRNNFGYGSLSCAINEGFKYVAQSYKANYNGFLVAIAIDVICHKKSEGHYLNVAILEVNNSYPSNELISWDLNIDESRLEDEIKLPKPIRQIAGASYAIVVNYPTGRQAGIKGGTEVGQWNGTTGNMYTQGGLFFSNNNKLWRGTSDHDLFFKTYIIQD
jgi:hypothetical protein